MPTPTTGVVPPRQARSRESYERVLAAADRLIAERPFSEISVTDLCNEADVSPSSLYARFRTKDAVLMTLYERHMQVVEERLKVAVTEAAAAGDSIDQLTHLVVAAFVGFIRDQAPLMQSIFDHPRLNERYWSVSENVAGALSGLVADFYDADDPAFLRRVDISQRIAAASLQRALGVPMNFGERLGIDDDELVDEITTMLVAYWERVLPTDGAAAR